MGTNISLAKSEPPPPANNQAGYRAEIIAKLKADPGEWYEIQRPNGWGSNAKSDWRKQNPNIEGAMRRVENDPPGAANPRYRLWLRWIDR